MLRTIFRPVARFKRSGEVFLSSLRLARLLGLELVSEGEFGGLLLQFGELVLVLGHFLEGGLDELALHVTDGDGELVDLEVAEDDLALEEEHLALQGVPLVEVLLADLLELVGGGVLEVGLGSTALGNDTESLLSLSLLLLLQLLSGLLSQKGAELLLALGGHESLLLGHCELSPLQQRFLSRQRLGEIWSV